MLNLHTELTDTFGGEANYSWVRRESLLIPDNLSRVAIMRRAKAMAGLSGCRGVTTDWGDSYCFRPYGQCVVLFVTFS